MMNAKEYLESVSPDDNCGLREALNKYTLRNLVESVMEKYAEYCVNEFLNEVTVERSEIQP